MATDCGMASTIAAKYGLEGVYALTSIEIDGVTHPAKPLDLSEMRIWTSEFDTLIAPLIYKGTVKRLLNNDVMQKDEETVPSGIVSSILRAKAQHLYAGAMIARDKLGLTFKGFYAAPGEMGWRHIKPCDMMRTAAAAETPSNTWEFAFAITTDNWLGFGAANATIANVDKNLLVDVVGVASPNALFEVEQLKFRIGNIIFPPVMLKPIMTLADAPEGVRAIPLKTLILPPKAQYFCEAYSMVAHTAQLIPLGVTYGDGKVLADLTRTTVEL